jgi:CheY-like chemotaxis protein
MLVAALTGYGLEEERQRARAEGFDLHLVKPVKIEYLESFLIRDSTDWTPERPI